MTLPSEILARQMQLPRAQTHDVDLRGGSPRPDGRRRRCCWPTAGWRASERDRAAADRPGPVAIRAQAVRRPAVRTAAGRAGAAGRRPERARHVRLRRPLQPVRRARRRPGDAALDPRAALARRADRDDRSELSRPGPVGGRAGRGRRSGGARRSRSAPRSFTARRTPAAACRSRPRPRGWCSSPSRSGGSRRWRWPARCAGCPRLLDRAAARGPRRAGDRRGGRLVSRGDRQPGARDAVLGRARLRGRRREGHRAGAAHRRLVRHLPALDARGLRGPARRRPRTRS